MIIIPYKEIIWLRDWISHDYFWIDLEIIWETLNEELPVLREKIILIIEEKK